MLVVEDEVILAMDLEAILAEQGCEVEAVNTIPRALDVLRSRRFDLATLDLNLNGKSSASVADALRDCSIPFLVITAYSDEFPLDPASRSAPLLKKPYSGEAVIRMLADLMT